MSVPKGARTEGQLQVMIELQALCTYTIQICKNEKNFPKRDRWILTQHIVKHAVDAYSLARQANAVRVSTMEDYKLRREYQIRCRTSLEALLGLIEIFGRTYISSELGDAIVFAVLIVVLLVRPTGLLGKPIREKV